MSQRDNRIVEYGVKPADQFQANPLNWRRHPQDQRDALAGVLDSVGWAAPVVENARTGHLIDGHERVWQALQNDNDQVPYVLVDVSEDEERTLLATFDPIAAMADTDQDKLAELLADVRSDDARVQQMLSDLAEEELSVFNVASGDLPDLDDGDESTIQQMTFTLHRDQVARVKNALGQAKGAGEFSSTGNENSNGNALARICEAYDV